MLQSQVPSRLPPGTYVPFFCRGKGSTFPLLVDFSSNVAVSEHVDARCQVECLITQSVELTADVLYLTINNNIINSMQLSEGVVGCY